MCSVTAEGSEYDIKRYWLLTRLLNNRSCVVKERNLGVVYSPFVVFVVVLAVDDDK
jgi:hypothetical protein